MALPWRIEGDRLFLLVRLTPKGGRDEIDGSCTLADGRVALQVRVRALPENGAANAALLAVLKDVLKVPARDIRLVSGATSRLKTIAIAAPYDGVPTRLSGLVGKPAQAGA